LPDRFHTTTKPEKFPIVSGELNSRTRPARPQGAENVDTSSPVDKQPERKP
jgi:hypothetical protein